MFDNMQNNVYILYNHKKYSVGLILIIKLREFLKRKNV